jgi:hypothetical protein
MGKILYQHSTAIGYPSSYERRDHRHKGGIDVDIQKEVEKIVKEERTRETTCKECGHTWLCVPMEGDICVKSCEPLCFKCRAKDNPKEYMEMIQDSECYKLESQKYKAAVLL